MNAALTTATPAVPLRRVVATWWPLAASWMLMSLEMPALSAVVARLPDPKINLAAYGGVVFPLSLIIESPIIMLLAASTALSKDWRSYRLIRRFMMAAGALLTALHALIAFTPLYYVVVEGIIGAPPEIVEPARLGLMIMLPWTWSIAFRRFNQGVLIRFGHSQTVGVGTLVRLSANLIVLTLGYLSGALPGVAVGAGAVAMGVMSEALYVGVVVRPVLKDQLRNAPPVEPPLSWTAFYAFYIPLVMTSLLTLLANPIGSAALSRMPRSLDSLAVWPVITGLVFLLRSLGIAYNEVVVALLDERGAYASLKRFAGLISLATTGLLLLVAATPLSRFWFAGVSGLPADLAQMAQRGLWLALPLPALSVLQSWYQGALLHGRRTRGITESVVIYLLTSALVLGLGVAWGGAIGLYVGLFALAASVAAQTGWLWLRSRPVLRTIRDEEVQEA
jgi:hypothetical protein